jgi:small-conductance mechanosensitive channel
VQQFLEHVDVTRLTTALIEFLPRLALALILLVGFWLLYRTTRPAFNAVLARAEFHPKLIELMVDNIYRYTLLIVALVMFADQLGVNVGAALAGIGVVGIALGFAAQDSVANVISGILIFWDKPFIVGDWIKVEGEFGQVANITLRTTRIRTNRNTFVVLPNKRIIDAVLENYSKQGAVRIDVPLGIAYKEDIRSARGVLLEAVATLDDVMDQPAPDVIVDELGSSSVNLLIRVWIVDAQALPRVTAAVVESAKLALDDAGIQIPFPHLQLFVDDVEERVWRQAARPEREAERFRTGAGSRRTDALR